MTDAPRIAFTLALSEDEARWLATAVAVLRRILQGAPISEVYARTGLAVLHRVAEQLPPGNYIEPYDGARTRPSNSRAKAGGEPA